MWDVERATFVARRTPGGPQVACRGEVMHACVAVAIRRKQITVSGGDHLRWLVERASRAENSTKVSGESGIGWRYGSGDCAHVLAPRGEHLDSMAADIGAVQQSIDPVSDRVGEF